MIRAFDVFARSNFASVRSDTQDGELRALLGRLRAEAIGASPEVRRECHFHATLALLESEKLAWLPELDAALSVTPEPGPVAKLDGKPKNRALRLWRFEVSRGIGGQRPDVPGSWRHDALWEAACAESAAVALEAEECWPTASRMRAEARERLARALAERGEAAA